MHLVGAFVFVPQSCTSSTFLRHKTKITPQSVTISLPFIVEPSLNLKVMLEIERKFLVKNDHYKQSAIKVRHIRQGYLSTSIDATVRVRIVDDEAYLTIKSRTVGATRGEWEYAVPCEDALAMIEATGCKCIEKRRYLIPESDSLTWEVDEFLQPHNGLTIAEIELPSEDTPFKKPDWVGEEVTGDPQYYNSEIVKML